ncbi:MAG TPA: hypothetical protein VME70_11650 [Mycobacteriales bacterium]|nr:hypothetical protein [Mycobacteriales bacterium]
MTDPPEPSHSSISAADAKGRWLTERVEADIHRAEERYVPAWLRPTDAENRIPAGIAIAVAIVLQLRLPNRYGVHPRWILPALEAALLVALTILNPVRLTRRTAFGRYAAILLVALITADNVISAILLDHDILTGGASNDATGLLASGSAIYLTNMIAFGLWYWEIDRGGPFARTQGEDPHPDFLFPQMTSPELAPADWEPRFLDYLYVSFTNVVAFSPTDTMPLGRGVKTLMAVQSLVALSTIGLVLARAVNVLNVAHH